MLRKTLLLIGAVLFIFGVSSLSFAMSCCGGSQHQQIAQVDTHERSHAGHGAVTTSAPQELANAGNKICPVSDEKIGQDMEPATYEYEGKIYNFCCAMCVEEFKKEPRKYIKKIEEELSAQKEKESDE